MPEYVIAGAICEQNATELHEVKKKLKVSKILNSYNLV